MRLNFSFTNYTQQKIPSGYFLSVLKNFLKKLKVKNNVEINLILVGKKRIQKLNHIYRKKNKPTDVLSFPIDITSPKQLPNTKRQPLILGDIYICPQCAEAQSLAFLQELFLHGLIHLIGYDHEKNAKEWKRIEKRIKV